MNLYELTYILRADLDDDAQNAARDRITTRLSDLGGEIVKSEGWGRRRLAFPIERLREGIYTTSILRMPGDGVRDFENQLKLVPEVLRFLLIRQEERNINLNGSLLPSAPRPAAAPASAPAAEETAVDVPAQEGESPEATATADEATAAPAEADAGPEAGAVALETAGAPLEAPAAEPREEAVPTPEAAAETQTAAGGGAEAERTEATGTSEAESEPEGQPEAAEHASEAGAQEA